MRRGAEPPLEHRSTVQFLKERIYFKNFDVVLSASTLPWVWQVGQ